MAENTEDAAALSEFWNSTVPLSQVRENLNPPNGTYDLLVHALNPKMDDNGLIFVAAEFKILAPASIATGPGSLFRRSLYIGTKKDAQAKLPETRLNSPGFRTLKAIARVTDQPTNDQPVGQLCANILGKSFTCRIETKPYTDKTGQQREGCDLGRNPVKLGAIPARLDSETGNGVAGQPKMATVSAEVAGATFGTD